MLIPEAENLFQRRFAPAMTLTDMNEVGAPVYLSPYVDPHNEFVEIKGQTNFISWNKRYEAMVIIEHGPTTDLEALGYYGQDTDSVYDAVDDLTAEELGITEKDVGKPAGPGSGPGRGRPRRLRHPVRELRGRRAPSLVRPSKGPGSRPGPRALFHSSQRA